MASRKIQTYQNKAKNLCTIYFVFDLDGECEELRERLHVDDIVLVLQQNRLRWYGHVLRKDDDDWVKKCMEHEVEGSRPRGRPGKRLYVRTVKHVS